MWLLKLAAEFSPSAHRSPTRLGTAPGAWCDGCPLTRAGRGACIATSGTVFRTASGVRAAAASARQRDALQPALLPVCRMIAVRSRTHSGVVLATDTARR